LFLNPATYQTEIVLDDFPRTVHELLAVPEDGLAYVCAAASRPGAELK
jgi:hypothetical protein